MSIMNEIINRGTTEKYVKRTNLLEGLGHRILGQCANLERREERRYKDRIYDAEVDKSRGTGRPNKRGLKKFKSL